MKLLITIITILCLFPIETRAHTQAIPPIDHKVQLIPWKEVENIIPRDAVFSIKDVETGKTFNVQRRAGSDHADVQPLTKKDTNIMKSIYKEWSWKRRAAIVSIDGQFIAASMNGMPHGAGALQNGFNGHFCLHFLNSSTHRSKEPDPAHHLMVLKAAGRIDDYLGKKTPEEILDVVMIAINNTDKTLLEKVVINDSQKSMKKLSKMYMTNWTIQSSKKDEKNPFVRHIQTKVEIYISDAGTITTVLSLKAKRDPLTSKWKIDTKPLLNIID
ncbi:hypothetical protein [Guptibacillus algicola]|uniref:hypothetical protein n=1 Tax=Guptibacillus algicola TaxID=225844 RepID=UPI001CD5B87B|nr:hypothetical protein [Alkalihalobacillus algicola]MCA0987873.1 hypothetical protein [Alkalihalobacillus algicola]